MKKIRTMLLMGMIALLSVAFVTEDAFARGGSRGGGSRSSGSRSRSTSRPKSSPSKQKTTQQKKTQQKKTWGSKSKTTSSKATAKPKMTAAQQKSLEIAKKNGTSFKSKTAAQDAFKTKYASTYTSKYTAKPATRPAHIPQTTSVGGTNYNVSYNQSYGGYGYMGPSGSWIMYDMMTDMAMMNMMMSQNNYVVHNPVNHRVHATHVNGHHRVLKIVIPALLITIIIVLIFVNVKK
jgi:hypothetical protein